MLKRFAIPLLICLLLAACSDNRSYPEKLDGRWKHDVADSLAQENASKEYLKSLEPIEMRFYFEKPTMVRKAVLDPEGLWLVDANLSNNSYARKGPGTKIMDVTTGLLWIAQNLIITIFGWL